MLDELSKDEKIIERKIQESDTLYAIVEEYKEMQEKYAKLKGLTQARKDLLVLYEDHGKVTEKQNISDTLFDCVNDIKNVDLKLINTTTLKKAISQIPALFSQEDAISIAIDSLHSIQKVVNQVESCTKQLVEVEKEYDCLKKEWKSYAGDSCPLCGHTIGGEI